MVAAKGRHHVRTSLLRHLACPACGGTLALVGAPPEAETVDSGALRCGTCACEYPVVGGVPRCLVGGGADDVTARTRRRYDFTWRRFGQREIEEGWEKDSLHYLPMIPKELFGGPGSLGLEAGCGGGRDLLNVAGFGAEVIGIDLSAGVESAHRATQHLPDVHVVQADVHRLPFRPGIFDFAYSFGALHHLPAPARGFEHLARLLKPGAPLVTYLYEDFGDRSAAARAGLGVVRGARRLSSRVPDRLLLALCWMGVPVIWTAFSVPARLLRRPWPRLAGRLPFRHTLRWSVLASDLFDRFAPPVEWRYGLDEIGRLYRESGFAGVETQRYRGWVSWGFKEDGAVREA